MFLSLETDSNIAAFKMEAIELSLSRKLSHAAAQKLETILKDDNMPVEELLAELKEIIASSKTLSWNTIVYLSNLKARFLDQVVKISPFQVGFILLFFMVGFFFYKKYISRSKKRAKYVFGLIENLLERFYAFLAYFLAIVQFYANYLKFLSPSFPLLKYVYPNFIEIAVSFYGMHANLISFTYFFMVFFVCLNLKLPKSRFVRFHIVRGLIIANFQYLPSTILTLVMGQTIYFDRNVLLFFVVVNLYFILPSITQALTHTYPKNAFIREAAEVILGRDDDPDFKWWNRDY